MGSRGSACAQHAAAREMLRQISSAVEAAGGGTERVCANPSMCKRAERLAGGRGSAAWDVLGQKCGHVRVWSPGKNLFLILQKLIVMAARVVAEDFDSSALPLRQLGGAMMYRTTGQHFFR